MASSCPDNAHADVAFTRSLRDVERGMSLLEIMVVLAIIALITATIGVAVHRRWIESQKNTAQIQVREVSKTIQQYIILRSRCPTADELVKERFVRREPADPWGMPLVIRCPGEQDPDGVDVVSLGPDKKEGTDDDIGSWRL